MLTLSLRTAAVCYSMALLHGLTKERNNYMPLAGLCVDPLLVAGGCIPPSQAGASYKAKQMHHTMVARCILPMQLGICCSGQMYVETCYSTGMALIDYLS